MTKRKYANSPELALCCTYRLLRLPFVYPCSSLHFCLLHNLSTCLTALLASFSGFRLRCSTGLHDLEVFLVHHGVLPLGSKFAGLVLIGALSSLLHCCSTLGRAFATVCLLLSSCALVGLLSSRAFATVRLLLSCGTFGGGLLRGLALAGFLHCCGTFGGGLLSRGLLLRSCLFLAGGLLLLRAGLLGWPLLARTSGGSFP